MLEALTKIPPMLYWNFLIKMFLEIIRFLLTWLARSRRIAGEEIPCKAPPTTTKLTLGPFSMTPVRTGELIVL